MRDSSSFLGLSRHPSGEDIRAAYWALSKQCHPDVNAGDKEAERRIKELNRAYGILGDPEARAAYNLILARARPGPSELLERGSNRRSGFYTDGRLHLCDGDMEAARGHPSLGE